MFQTYVGQCQRQEARIWYGPLRLRQSKSGGLYHASKVRMEHMNQRCQTIRLTSKYSAYVPWIRIITKLTAFLGEHFPSQMENRLQFPWNGVFSCCTCRRRVVRVCWCLKSPKGWNWYRIKSSWEFLMQDHFKIPKYYHGNQRVSLMIP